MQLRPIAQAESPKTVPRDWDTRKESAMSENLDVMPEEPEFTAAEAEQAETVDETATDEVVEETAASEGDAEQAEEKPKRRSRAEERINALTREKYEAQQAAQAAQKRIAEYEAALRDQQMAKPQTEPPKLAEYDYDEARYQQAFTQWHQAELSKVKEAQQQQAYEQQAYQQQMADQARLHQIETEAVKKYPDWAAKVYNPQLPNLAGVNPTAMQALKESPNAGDIAYYLASNPHEVYKFAEMTPVQAVFEVARLSSQFDVKTKQVRTPPPPPSNSLKGTSEAMPTDMSKLSTEQYAELRRRQLAEKRK